MDRFERLTGFPERPYTETQRRLSVTEGRLRCEGTDQSYAVGTLTLPPLAELHIRQHHPRCPGNHAHQIILRVLGWRRWRDRPLGEAVGVEMQNYIRHELTKGDKLFTLQGASEVEVRAAVKAQVEKHLVKWDRPRNSCAASAVVLHTPLDAVDRRERLGASQ